MKISHNQIEIFIYDFPGFLFLLSYYFTRKFGFENNVNLIVICYKVDVPIQQSYLWYGSSPGDTDPQVSTSCVRIVELL